MPAYCLNTLPVVRYLAIPTICLTWDSCEFLPPGKGFLCLNANIIRTGLASRIEMKGRLDMTVLNRLLRAFPIFVGVTLLTTLSGSAFATTVPNTTPVVPVSVPDVVSGHKIQVGYQVGDSIVYPSTGGYSILANPNKKWTNASKKAYVRNQQALKDLLTFSNSKYSHSPEAEAAGKIPPVRTQIQRSRSPLTANVVSSTSVSSGFVHFTFNDWDYFNVSGNSQGGFISDSSVLTGESDPISTNSSFQYPSNYLGWRPATSVMDLVGTPNNVKLNLSWNFSGWTFGISYPFPSVSPSSSGGTWNSGPQPTWDYTWVPSQQVIYTSSGVQSINGTTETIRGTVNVQNAYGGITGYTGTHTIGWNGNFLGNNS